MKIALITTTINEPRVLAHYRQLGPDVSFFVAADEKTPLAAFELCADIDNCEIYSPDRQRELGYECSPLLGWNNDSRRNIALLEAVKYGADIIVSVDDDMLPTPHFFDVLTDVFVRPYSGLQMGTTGEWFDAGQLTVEPAPQRGLPLDHVANHASSFVHNVEIGAMQGIILGVPDTDALTARNNPVVLSATDVLRNGLVVHPAAKAVFNSQLTAFRRELAPCFAQFNPWQGRNTDIFASLIMRRVMRDMNLYTYFGPPTAFHARTKRDPMLDLKAEMWGLERVETLSAFLDAVQLPTNNVIENLRFIWRALAATDMGGAGVAALAFLDDMEKVL